MSVQSQVVSAHTRDPAEYELTLRPWELHCRPQAAGVFQHAITAICSQSFVIYRETYDLPIAIQGLSPSGMFAFSVPLAFKTDPFYWGDRCADAEIPGLLPGAVDARFGARHSHIVVLVALDHLQEFLCEESLARLQVAAQSRRFALPAGDISDFAWWSTRLIDVAASHPKRFDEPAVVDSVLGKLVDFLALVADNQSDANGIADLGTRRRGLSRALEFLRYRFDSRVSIGELCQEAGVSERSLQTVFREEFGVSPTEFMRRRRMHAVRQKLLTASRAETTVSQVAMQCGFYELGRFAVQYRRLFGESPSTTLSCDYVGSGLAERHL